MSTIRIALANLPFPATPEESVASAERGIADAGAQRADIVCFPEAYVPGYRIGKNVAPPDRAFLDRAWSRVAAAAAKANVAVVLGTERVLDDGLRIAAMVFGPDGAPLGIQDKVQLDPSEDGAVGPTEEGTYVPGAGRQIFQVGPLTFGIAICHEGFRYPETVRWAARRGAQLVFHPHFHEADPGGYRPSTYGEPGNSFHEKAALCRAAENTCFYATVNCATEGSSTTSAIIRPDGRVLAYQPYGKAGLLVADIDLTEATRLLASRCRTLAV